MASKNQREIEALQNEIMQIETDIEIEKGEIERLSKVCIKQYYVTKTILNKFIKAVEVSVDLDAKEQDQANASAAITDYRKAFPCLDMLVDPIQAKKSNEWTLKLKKEDLKELKSNSNKTIKEVYEEKAQEVAQDGHLYPVAMVSNATAKLKQYNAQLDSFINGIETLNVNVDISWLCQKVEAFCRRINYALALLRYQIIKGLSKIFEQAQVFKKYIQPITKMPSINTILTWVGDVVKYFLGPYMIVIQFIQDFMTYTPPLIAEATKLTANVATVPIRVISKLDVTVQTKKDAKSDAIKQASENSASGKSSATAISSSLANDNSEAMVEMYKDDIKLEFKPISMGDVMGGSPQLPEQPKNQGKEKQKELYTKQAKNAEKESEQIWQEFEQELLSAHSSLEHDSWFSAFPEKLTKLEGSGWFVDKLCNGYLTQKAYTDRQMAEKIFGKERVETSNYHFLQIDTSRFPVYHAITTDHLCLNTNSILDRAKDSVKSYYLACAEDNTDRANVLRPYIDFFKDISTKPGFGFVMEYVESYGVSIMDSIELANKKDELEAPTVYD